jgi:MFS family permease
MNARVSELEELYKRPLMNANHAMFSVGYAISAVASGFAREAQIAPGMAFSYVALIIFVLSAFLYMPVRDTSNDTPTGAGYPFWPIVLCGLIVLVAFMTGALAPTPLWAYVGFGILGLGVSVIGPLGLALVGKSVPNNLRTEAISRVAVMGFAGFFLAPTLMGMVSEFHGLPAAFLCAAALSLMAIPLTLLLRRL